MSPPPGHQFPFQFQCTRCGSVLEATIGQSGQAARCPTCEAEIVVPDADPKTGLAVDHADPGDDGENPTPMHAYAAAGEKAPQLIRREDDTLIIECPRCKSHNIVNANSCKQCGIPFTLEGATFKVNTASSEPGHLAVVLGLLGIGISFCFGIGIVPGIFAITLGLRARSKRPQRRFGAPEFGILLGALAIVISLGTLLVISGEITI